MCIICLEFNKRKDAWDALNMIARAYEEPCNIEKQHLQEVEAKINKILTEEERLES